MAFYSRVAGPMLRRLFERSVELSVADGRLKFRNLRELEYALGGKTALSSLRISSLGDMTDDALIREAKTFRRMEQQILDAVARPQSGVDEFLAELDLTDITEDHGWRSLLSGLRLLDGKAADYKQAALLKYAGYLASAQEVIRIIRVNRLGNVRPAEDGKQPGPPAEPRERQSLVFELRELARGAAADAPPDRDGYSRMTRGEPVAIRFGAHQSMDLILARYRFTLVSGTPFLLIDEAGHDLKIRPGKNVVGRSARCDVTLDGAYGAISRKHLIVEINYDERVRLTDVSSLGTFVHRAFAGKN